MEKGPEWCGDLFFRFSVSGLSWRFPVLSVSLVFAAFLKLEAANSIRSSHVP